MSFIQSFKQHRQHISPFGPKAFHLEPSNTPWPQQAGPHIQSLPSPKSWTSLSDLQTPSQEIHHLNRKMWARRLSFPRIYWLKHHGKQNKWELCIGLYYYKNSRCLWCRIVPSIVCILFCLFFCSTSKPPNKHTKRTKCTKTLSSLPIPPSRQSPRPGWHPQHWPAGPRVPRAAGPPWSLAACNAPGN